MTESPPRAKQARPSRLRTLRVQVTVVAGLALTVSLVLGLLLVYLIQVQSVRRTVDGQLRTYAAQIAESAAGGTLPNPLPTSSLDPVAEAQVLSADGRVLAATRTLTGLPALYRLSEGSDTLVRQKAADGVLPEEIHVVGLRATIGGQRVTIFTGTSTRLLTQVSDGMTHLVLLGAPTILILAAGTIWLVVGRALRPVERIRRAVTAITAADLAQRVPEPGTHDEIGHLAETMNDMLARLEDSARRQRRFVADASHELRSPLAAIRTSLDVGLAHPGKAPWPDIAERAVRQSARLEELIQQLLLLAKADDHHLAARRQPVEIAALWQEILATTVAPQRDIKVTTASDAVTTGDPGHLSRMLRNILDNAIRHATHRIQIATATTPGLVRVQISDDGPGIPPAERERVFDRFVRLDSSRERLTGSTGLGLAIAKEIATAHGGRITITEAALGGARVVVELPRGVRSPG